MPFDHEKKPAAAGGGSQVASRGANGPGNAGYADSVPLLMQEYKPKSKSYDGHGGDWEGLAEDLGTVFKNFGLMVLGFNNAVFMKGSVENNKAVAAFVKTIDALAAVGQNPGAILSAAFESAKQASVSGAGAIIRDTMEPVSHLKAELASKSATPASLAGAAFAVLESFTPSGKGARGVREAAKAAEHAAPPPTALAKHEGKNAVDDVISAGAIQKHIFKGHLPKGMQWAALTEDAVKVDGAAGTIEGMRLLDATKDGLAPTIERIRDVSIAQSQYLRDDVAKAAAPAVSTSAKSKTEAIAALRDRAGSPHGHPDATMMVGDGTGLHIYQEPPYRLVVAFHASDTADVFATKHAWTGKGPEAQVAKEVVNTFDQNDFRYNSRSTQDPNAFIPALFSSTRLPPEVRWAHLDIDGTSTAIGNFRGEAGHEALTGAMPEAIAGASRQMAEKELGAQVHRSASYGNPMPRLAQKVSEGAYDVAIRNDDGSALLVFRHDDAQLVVAVNGTPGAAAGKISLEDVRLAVRQPDPAVAMKALRTIERMEPTRVIDFCEELLRTERRPEVRREALRVLSAQQDPRAKHLLTEMLMKGDGTDPSNILKFAWHEGTFDLELLKTGLTAPKPAVQLLAAHEYSRSILATVGKRRTRSEFLQPLRDWVKKNGNASIEGPPGLDRVKRDLLSNMQRIEEINAP